MLEDKSCGYWQRCGLHDIVLHLLMMAWSFGCMMAIPSSISWESVSLKGEAEYGWTLDYSSKMVSNLVWTTIQERPIPFRWRSWGQKQDRRGHTLKQESSRASFALELVSCLTTDVILANLSFMGTPSLSRSLFAHLPRRHPIHNS